MFHEHINTLFIFYIFLVSCLLHMALHIIVKYDVCGITPHSYILIPLLIYSTLEVESIQDTVMAFSCQLVGLQDYTGNSWYY